MGQSQHAHIQQSSVTRRKTRETTAAKVLQRAGTRFSSLQELPVKGWKSLQELPSKGTSQNFRYNFGIKHNKCPHNMPCIQWQCQVVWIVVNIGPANDFLWVIHSVVSVPLPSGTKCQVNKKALQKLFAPGWWRSLPNGSSCKSCAPRIMSKIV